MKKFLIIVACLTSAQVPCMNKKQRTIYFDYEKAIKNISCAFIDLFFKKTIMQKHTEEASKRLATLLLMLSQEYDKATKTENSRSHYRAQLRLFCSRIAHNLSSQERSDAYNYRLPQLHAQDKCVM